MLVVAVVLEHPTAGGRHVVVEVVDMVVVLEHWVARGVQVVLVEVVVTPVLVELACVVELVVVVVVVHGMVPGVQVVEVLV